MLRFYIDVSQKNQENHFDMSLLWQKRGEHERDRLLAIESKCDVSFLSEGWSVSWAEAGALQWACRTCIKESRALCGKPWIQRWCDFSPYFAYFDVTLSCTDCQNTFIFSAAEQQFWYEDLRFWVQSRPKQCKRCRKARRVQKDLQKDLAKLLTQDRSDPLVLAKIASCYFQMNNNERSLEFLQQANNVARRSHQEEELQEFLLEHNLELFQ